MRTTVLQKAMLLFLCMSILLATSMPICAAQNTTVSATVIANNAPTYQITIPATIEASDLSRTAQSSIYCKEFAVTVSSVSELNGKQICLRLYSEGEGFHLKNSDTEDLLPFAVHGPITPDTPLQSGDVFARFSEAKTETGSIRIDQKDILSSGTYTGSILFSISVE